MLPVGGKYLKATYEKTNVSQIAWWSDGDVLLHSTGAAIGQSGYRLSQQRIIGSVPTCAAHFRNGLAEEGFVEGKNLAIEYRFADGRYDRLPGLAEDLVRRHVEVVSTSGGSSSALAVYAATRTIPIVSLTGGDLVVHRIYAILIRPVSISAAPNVDHRAGPGSSGSALR